VTFYAWLSSQPDTYPFLLRRYREWRIPQATNKLCKLLRFIDKQNRPHGATRLELKKAHRAWRAYLAEQEKNFVTIDIEAIQPPPFDDIVALSGLKPTGDFTISGRWVPSDHPLTVSALLMPATQKEDRFELHTELLWNRGHAEDLLPLQFSEDWSSFLFMTPETLDLPPKPDRWERVYRRWGFKHREKCAHCGANRGWFTKLNLGGLTMCADSDACMARVIKILATAHEQD
jgi:hypothetical protein